MAERVVVTGSSGMLGGHLAEYLVAKGCEVTGVDLRPPVIAAPRWRHREGDVRDTGLLTEIADGADAVVHCASALPSYPANQIRDVILGGTVSMMEACRRARVARVVHISSTAVYGLPSLVPTPEDYPREPVDDYGRAKLAAEEVVEGFRATGMCVSVIRPKTFLGVGRMGLFAMLGEWGEEGRGFAVLGSGEVRIQMLAIEDLMAAVDAALSASVEVANDTYNVAAAEFGTIRQDFQAVLDMAGHGKRVVSLPAKPALYGLRTLQRTGMSPVYGRLLNKLLADSYVSIDKAKARLGFQPRWSNQDAILRTYQWWRDQRADNSTRSQGQTSRDAWRQGALSLAKVFF